MSSGSRRETDFAGEVLVPDGALWGAQTQRAIDTFTISDLRLPHTYVRVLGSLKRAAALANRDLGLLDERLSEAIARAAAEVADGQHDDQFRVDLFQTGSGTNMNMNVNEVIANRANVLLGSVLGARHPVHPNDHVNLGQSSNDVTPTVIHIAAMLGIQRSLVPAVERLVQSLRAAAARTAYVVKTGRTHLQDAVPITLGQEFEGHAGQLDRGLGRLRDACTGLSEVALGGTAIGTGVNGHPAFAAAVLEHLSGDLNLDAREAANHFRAQNNADDILFASGALRTLAASLLKVAEDIRWMSSGPRAGLGEIRIDSLGMGSSIMPGKANPVLAEAVIQVAAKVVGNDATIAAASAHAHFEIIVTSPVIAYALLESIDILGGACTTFAEKCVDSIEATPHGPEVVQGAPMLATALTPLIGYDAAVKIMQQSAVTGRSVFAIASEELDIDSSTLRGLLDPLAMTGAAAEGAPVTEALSARV